MDQSAFIKQPLPAAKRRLEQLINCFLCNDKVRGANMCPYCSRLFCESCIKCVLQNRSDCPHCHKALKMSNLSQCSRFMLELSTLVEQLIEHRNLDELCLDHNVAQDYYCQDCMLPVCCQCCFFGEHHDHKITSLKNIYEPKVDFIKNQLQVLRKQMKVVEARCEELQPQPSGLKKQKGRLLTEIQQTQQFYNLKILHDIVNRQTELEEVQKMMNLHLSDIQQFTSRLERSLATSTPINQSQNQKNQQQFLSLVEKQFQRPNNLGQDMEFLVEIFPEFYSSTFTLLSFSSKVNVRQPIYSPSIHCDGNEWCLKIYPSGCDDIFGYYFTVFLELRSSLCHIPMKYQYKIELINHKSPAKNIIKSFTSLFEPGENWGYSKYIQLNKLFKEGYISNSDTVVLNYYIRPVNYSNLSIQKQHYIMSLQEEIRRQEEELRELQNR